MIAILGLSAFYHDSAAALIIDGQIVAAAQQERFSRIKHDPGFPEAAIRYCLKQAGISVDQLSAVVFYDKPLLKFERLLESYLTASPRGLNSFQAAMPRWIKEKLYTKVVLRRELCKISGLEKTALPPLLFSAHHMAHAAAAFYPSEFDQAAILCIDGVGEWATTSLWLGHGADITPQWELHFPHSLGLLYTAFTTYLGFRANAGEYKMMGLAPYGKPVYSQLILDNLIDVASDGSFRLNMDFFGFTTDLSMTNKRFHQLFGAPPRVPESNLTQQHKDIAASIQAVTEQVLLRLAQRVFEETGERNLCLAGGVALNCVANGRLLRESPFDQIWIQPASGDAGSAVGAALAAWHQYFAKPRVLTDTQKDLMQGALLGPDFSNQEIETWLEKEAIPYDKLEQTALSKTIARELASGKVIGWFQGRMEFGPRALGNRSILASPLIPDMQQHLNLKIKRRESFRPFAPVVIAERAQDYFDIDRPMPYMQFVSAVRSATPLPAITHVDHSARVETLSKTQNPRLYELLGQFENETGCPVLINTSFNRRGEPIVCTPEDAYRTFCDTDMDSLVVGNYLINQKNTPDQSSDPITHRIGTAHATASGFKQHWRQFALALGRFNNRLILSLIFLLLIIPIGLVLRLFRLNLKQSVSVGSYRIHTHEKQDPKRMEKPF